MYLSGRLGESGFGPGDLGEDVRRAGSPEKGFGLVPLPTPVASRIVALVQAMNGQRPPRYLSAADLRRELGV